MEQANLSTQSTQNGPPSRRDRNSPRLVVLLLIALAAGAFATAINMALLAALEAAGIRTAHGGLLRLLSHGLLRTADLVRIHAPWQTQAQHLFTTAWFQSAFHIGTGLAMALSYILLLGRRTAASPVLRGFLCGAAVWLFNALAVLPAIGEGFAGNRHLSAAGITGFALAHMSYFLALSLLTDDLLSRFTTGSTGQDATITGLLSAQNNRHAKNKSE